MTKLIARSHLCAPVPCDNKRARARPTGLASTLVRCVSLVLAVVAAFSGSREAIIGATVALPNRLRYSRLYSLDDQPNVAPITRATCTANGPDYPVDLPAACSIVVKTAYLGWEAGPAGAGGVAHARLSSWQMVVVFGQRLSASQAPRDLPAARTVTPLNLGLAGLVWARILNQLVASGFDSIVATCRSELIDGVPCHRSAVSAIGTVTGSSWDGEKRKEIATPPSCSVNG